MRKNWKGAAAVFAALAVALLVIGCSSSTSAPPAEQHAEAKGTVVIGSKIDTEGELLATIVQQLLESKGFTVTDKSQTGTTDVVRKALLAGDIDLYPEYTGSGLIFFEGDPAATPETFKDPEKGYETVKQLDLEKNGVAWLTPAKANNTWLIAVKKDFAETNGLKTMSDFAKYLNDGKTVKLAASDEFFNNADAWPAFASTYGIELKDNQKLIFSGGNTAQTEKAVAAGTEGVNFGMAYGTDGALADLGLTVLEDDKGAQLVYWPVPIIRKAVLDTYPQIEADLAPAFEALTIDKLQELNARIQVNGESAEAVAKDFLTSGGFIK
jgi:osmoprotectant transport system substrate-binding protein